MSKVVRSILVFVVVSLVVGGMVGCGDGASGGVVAQVGGVRSRRLRSVIG